MKARPCRSAAGRARRIQVETRRVLTERLELRVSSTFQANAKRIERDLNASSAEARAFCLATANSIESSCSQLHSVDEREEGALDRNSLLDFSAAACVSALTLGLDTVRAHT